METDRPRWLGSGVSWTVVQVLKGLEEFESISLISSVSPQELAGQGDSDSFARVAWR